jgi:hypothetical protein
METFKEWLALILLGAAILSIGWCGGMLTKDEIAQHRQLEKANDVR